MSIGRTTPPTKAAPATPRPDQINSDNFDQLRVVWRYRPPDQQIYETAGPNPEGRNLQFDNNRGTPLAVNGVLYYASPFNVLVALDGQSGEELWTFDPEAWGMNFRFLGNLRGVSYWTDGEVERNIYGHFDLLFVLHRCQDRRTRPGLRRGWTRRFGGLATPAAGRK